MNKKEKGFELKLYELLGVKTFRKMAFKLCKICLSPLTIKMSKEERHEWFKSLGSYNMKKGHGVQDLIDFKKDLRFNASIHLIAFLVCFPDFLKVIGIITEPISVGATIFNILNVGINGYCVMLQRYNWIRIDKTIKRFELRENAKKEEIKEETEKQDSELSENTYKRVQEREKEQLTSFDELIENATLQQLQEYRKCCMNVSGMVNGDEDYFFNQESQDELFLSSDNNKTL